MKGIKCCGECAYYNMKKHKCMGGAKDPGKAEDSFYVDCPHIEVEPVRHRKGCEYCEGRTYTKKLFAVTTPTMNRVEVCFNFCPKCGRDMRVIDTNVAAQEVLTMQNESWFTDNFDRCDNCPDWDDEKGCKSHGKGCKDGGADNG